MVIAPARKTPELLVGVMRPLLAEERAKSSALLNAYRRSHTMFLYQPATGALFERGVELPTRVSIAGPVVAHTTIAWYSRHGTAS